MAVCNPEMVPVTVVGIIAWWVGMYTVVVLAVTALAALVVVGVHRHENRQIIKAATKILTKAPSR